MRVHLATLSMACLLTACAAGPDFRTPAAPAATRYVSGEQPQSTASTSTGADDFQRFAPAASSPERWWELFQCPALNALVSEALTRSPTVLEARARLREAQSELTAQTRGTLYPAVDAKLGAARQKVDPAAFGFKNIPAAPPFTLYNAQLEVSYSLDVFGGDRRAVESARARTETVEYESRIVQLSLAANVVTAAIRQADLQGQLETLQWLLEAQQRQVAISEVRYEAGGISLQELQDQRARLEQARASLPPLRAQRQQVDHQLAAYTGQSPAAAAIPRFRLQDLTLPREIPLVLPSELVRSRPDVRASEARWHQASAELGVATANLFPHLSVSGNIGSQRTRLSDLVDGTNVWSIGATLMQPIFHAGELRARKTAARDAYEGAAQAYEQTVLEALQQVADGLRILEADAEVLRSRNEAARQADANAGIAETRYAAGGISEYALLDSRRQQLQSAMERDHAESQRFADTAALLHALNGTP